MYKSFNERGEPFDYFKEINKNLVSNTDVM